MPYPIPPWLSRDTDPSGKYLSGLQLGAQIQMQSQRLAQEAQETSLRTQIAQQQDARDFQFKQQQAALNEAMSQQELQLKQQDLAMRQEQNKWQTMLASREFSARQRAQQRINAGEDPAKVQMEAYFDLYQSPLGMASLQRAQQMSANIPLKIQTAKFGGKEHGYLFDPSTRRVYWAPSASARTLSDADSKRYQTLSQDRNTILKGKFFGTMRDVYRESDPKGYEEAKRDLQKIVSEMNQLVPPREGGGQTQTQGPGQRAAVFDANTGAIVPLTQDQDNDAQDWEALGFPTE